MLFMVIAGLALSGPGSSASADDVSGAGTPQVGTCLAPDVALTPWVDVPATIKERVTPVPGSDPGRHTDARTAERILSGIENFIACRNAGEFAVYAALLTPNRIEAESGTTDPLAVVTDLEQFNLPITTLALGDVRAHADGRYSAEFVHLFGDHLYYRSRLYVVASQSSVFFDEERFLPEDAPGPRSAVDIFLTEYALDVGEATLPNAPYIVLRGTNNGHEPHEIVVVRLPAGATAEQALTGGVPEEEIEFVGQVSIAPGQSDDLVLVNMEAAVYTLLCLESEPDDIPHAARGMAATLVVQDAETRVPQILAKSRLRVSARLPTGGV